MALAAVALAAAAREEPRERLQNSVAQALPRSHVRRVQKCLRLLERQPVAHTNTVRPDALYSRDPRCQLRRQQAIVGRLNRQLPHRRDSDINRDRSESPSFERVAQAIAEKSPHSRFSRVVVDAPAGCSWTVPWGRAFTETRLVKTSGACPLLVRDGEAGFPFFWRHRGRRPHRHPGTPICSPVPPSI